MATLTPVTRPDGRVYRPRKPPRVQRIDNDDFFRESGPDFWVYVLGTHDFEQAFELASKAWSGLDWDSGERAWLRLGYQDGEPAYVYDPVRGAPTVIFNGFEP